MTTTLTILGGGGLVAYSFIGTLLGMFTTQKFGWLWLSDDYSKDPRGATAACFLWPLMLGPVIAIWLVRRGELRREILAAQAAAQERLLKEAGCDV